MPQAEKYTQNADTIFKSCAPSHSHVIAAPSSNQYAMKRDTTAYTVFPLLKMNCLHYTYITTNSTYLQVEKKLLSSDESILENSSKLRIAFHLLVALKILSAARGFVNHKFHFNLL